MGENCQPPLMDGYPQCADKIKVNLTRQSACFLFFVLFFRYLCLHEFVFWWQWMKNMWQSDPCYSRYGVNGSLCSILIYLSEVTHLVLHIQSKLFFYYEKNAWRWWLWAEGFISCFALFWMGRKRNIRIFFEVFIFWPDTKVLGDIFVALLILTSDTSLVNKNKTVQTYCAIHWNLKT